MPTAQQQVTADIAAMQTARNDLNSANAIVTASKLTTAQKSAIHTQLATVAGVLQNAQTAAQAWLTANPIPPPPASLPGAPTGLSATPGTTNAALVWSAPSSNGGSAVTGYQLTLNGTVIVPNVVGLSDTLSGLTADTSYTVSVGAVNSVGIGPVVSVTFTTENVAPPPPPPPNPDTWQPIPQPTAGNVADFLGSNIGQTNLNGASPSLVPMPKNYANVWQGESSSPSWTGCTGAGGYSVRDHNGVVVMSGVVSGDVVTLAPPSGGWTYGWYRLYLWPSGGPSNLAHSANNLLGAVPFIVCRTNPNLPPVPPPSYTDPGWVWETGSLGYGTVRWSINDATVQPNPDAANIATNVVPAMNEWWLKNYLDPVRSPHEVLVSFPNGAITAAQLAGVTAIVKQLVPLGVNYFEGPTNEPANFAATGFAAEVQAFAEAVHAGGGKAVGPCPVAMWGGPDTGWDTFLARTPTLGNTLLVMSCNAGAASGCSGGGVTTWTKQLDFEPQADFACVVWTGVVTGDGTQPITISEGGRIWVFEFEGALDVLASQGQHNASGAAMPALSEAGTYLGFVNCETFTGPANGVNLIDQPAGFDLEAIGFYASDDMAYVIGEGVPVVTLLHSGATTTGALVLSGSPKMVGRWTFRQNEAVACLPGGAEYLDVVSTHGYNSVIFDPVNSGRRNWLALKKTLLVHNTPQPLWMTECGIFQAVNGVFHARRGRSVLSFYLCMEEAGVPREQVTYFYTKSMGFWDFASFWETNGPGGTSAGGGQLPSSAMQVTLAQETFGKAYQSSYRFGLPLDHEVMSLLFATPNGGPSVVCTMAGTVVDDCYVSFEVSTTEPLMVVDAFGNESTVAPQTLDGMVVVTLPIYDQPTYLELPVGVTATAVQSIAGANLALSATADSPLINDGAIGPGPGYDPNDPGPYQGTVAPAETAPDTTVKLTWPTAQTIGRVVIYAGECWQHMSTLTDFDIVNQAGTVLASIQRPIPAPLGYCTPWEDVCCCVEVFWNEQWIFDVTLPEPVSVTGIGLVVRAVSAGGEPNAFCATNTNNIGQGDYPGFVTVSEIEVFA